MNQNNLYPEQDYLIERVTDNDDKNPEKRKTWFDWKKWG